MQISPSTGACGATITGVDLSRPMSNDDIEAVRRAWLEHKVIIVEDQTLNDADLERLIGYFGSFSDEPYFVPVSGSEHVVALTRRADETAPIFAESWHTDWSFQAQPPIASALYGLVIPPVGGQTSFINQQLVWEKMPTAMRERLRNCQALHSAAVAYAPEGLYGEAEKDSDRSMKITYSEDAKAVQAHPLIQRHPETGLEAVFGCFGYIIGIADKTEEEAAELLLELYNWQTREEFQYIHQWKENMFVMWDNRSVLHKANGGYDGYHRELHRITIGVDESRFLQL